MPPLTISDLPPNPPPYDGKSNLLVLAYRMPERHILWWADKHKIQRQLNGKSCIPYERMGAAVLKMRDTIPEEWSIAMVRSKNDICFSWAYITNEEDDLKLADNLESIEKVRKAIGARGAPQWYEYEY